MDQEYFRRFARRCRELTARTNNDTAKEQLLLWAAEFDARALAFDEPPGAGCAESPLPGQSPAADADRREASR